MMDFFFNTLQHLPIETCASSSSGNFGGTPPFKVQVNFDIPVFKGQIDLLEGYFYVDNFFGREKSPSYSSRVSPMSKIGGKLTKRKVPQRNLEYMRLSPLGIFVWMWSRKNITLLITMKTST
jgi:hypothetical protein